MRHLDFQNHQETMEDRLPYGLVLKELQFKICFYCLDDFISRGTHLAIRKYAVVI